MDSRKEEKHEVLGYQAGGEEDEGRWRRMDRLEGCFIWGLGLPVLLVVVAGLLAGVWAWEATGRGAESAKWVVSVAIVVGVGTMVWGVTRVRRK